MSTTEQEAAVARFTGDVEGLVADCRVEVERAHEIHALRQREGRTIGAKRRARLVEIRDGALRLSDAVARLAGEPRPSVLRERRRLERSRAERLAD